MGGGGWGEVEGVGEVDVCVSQPIKNEPRAVKLPGLPLHKLINLLVVSLENHFSRFQKR